MAVLIYIFYFYLNLDYRIYDCSTGSCDLPILIIKRHPLMHNFYF